VISNGSKIFRKCESCYKVNHPACDAFEPLSPALTAAFIPTTTLPPSDDKYFSINLLAHVDPIIHFPLYAPGTLTTVQSWYGYHGGMSDAQGNMWKASTVEQARGNALTAENNRLLGVVADHLSDLTTASLDQRSPWLRPPSSDWSATHHEPHFRKRSTPLPTPSNRGSPAFDEPPAKKLRLAGKRTADVDTSEEEQEGMHVDAPVDAQ
jgi:hypothetical protein